MPHLTLSRSSLCRGVDSDAEACPIVELLDLISEPVAVVGADRRVVLANDAYVRLAGNRPVIGKRPGETLRCLRAGEQPGGCGCSAFCRVCEVLDALRRGLKGEKTMRHASMLIEGGESLEVDVQAAPLRVGAETFCVLSVIDRTAERRRQVLERVFLHDVLNTVGSLSGFTELLREQHGELAEYLDIIDNLSREVRDEIQAHRELAEAESRELQLSPSLFDARDLVEQVARNCSARGHHRRTIRVADDAAHAVVCTDVRLLRRILSNMVANAIDATGDSDVISMRCRAEGEGVRFEVHNPGCIPDEIGLRIFRRSFSTRGEGRGLGTYSMRLFGEKWLGGKVGFRSTEAEGTTFFVDLPNLQEAPPEHG